MSILINGMEMPTDGSMIFAIRPDGMVEDVMGCCVGKAVPVPSHGRLGDLDALTRRILEEHDKFQAMNQYDSGLRAGYRASAKAVRLSPTIIPASEEGE